MFAKQHYFNMYRKASGCTVVQLLVWCMYYIITCFLIEMFCLMFGRGDFSQRHQCTEEGGHHRGCEAGAFSEGHGQDSESYFCGRSWKGGEEKEKEKDKEIIRRKLSTSCWLMQLGAIFVERLPCFREIVPWSGDGLLLLGKENGACSSCRCMDTNLGLHVHVKDTG